MCFVPQQTKVKEPGLSPSGFAATGLISAFGDGNLMFKRARLLFLL